MGKKRSISRKEIIYRQVDNYSDDEKRKLDRYVSKLHNIIKMKGLISSLGCHYKEVAEEFAVSKLRYEKYHDIPELDCERVPLYWMITQNERQL